MRRTLMLLAATLLVPAAADAQTIRGTVVEDGTRQPIHGAVVELRLEDEDGNPALGLSSEAGGQAMLEIDRDKDGSLRFTGVIEAGLMAHPMSGRTAGGRQMLVLDVDGGRITATGH